MDSGRTKINSSLVTEYLMNEGYVVPIEEKQQEFFKKNDDDKFLGVILHHNNLFVDDITPPKGNVCSYDGNTDAKVIHITPRLGSIIIAVPIKNSNIYNDDYFREKLSDLKIDADPSKIMDFDLLVSPDKKDIREWDCSLGGNKNSVSIIKYEIKRGEYAYYIRVQTDGQSAGAGFSSKVQERHLKGNPYSLSDICDSKEYNSLLLLSKRNAQRIAYKVSKKLGVNVEHYDDPWAKVEPYVEAPQLAVPTIENVFNSMRKHKVGNKNCVLSFNHVVDTSKAKGGLFFCADPTFKQRLYSLYDKKNGGYQVKNLENKAFNSFPTFTSKYRSRNIYEQEKSIKKLPTGIKYRVKNSMTWDGKTGDNDFTHPILYMSHSQMDSDTVGNKAHEYNKNVLGAKFGHVDFDTVVCNIAPPSLH